MTFLRRSLLLLPLLALCCVKQVSLDTLAIPDGGLRLGETDITPFVAAADTLSIHGRADLAAGVFSLEAGDYRAIEIAAGTTMIADAEVSLAFVEEDGNVGVQPSARTFSIEFSQPIVLLGRDSSLRVSVEAAHLTEGSDSSVDVNLRMGKTLVQSLATAITGSAADDQGVPASLDMFERIEVDTARLSLREGTNIESGSSTYVVGSASYLEMSRMDIRPSVRNWRLDLDANINLTSGTCVSSAIGQLCVDSGNMELHGSYSRRLENGRGVQRLMLTTVDRPSRLSLGRGRLVRSAARGSGGEEVNGELTEDLTAGDIALHRADLAVARYECGGVVGSASACERSLEGSLSLGAGVIAFSPEQKVRFTSLRIERARLGLAGLGSSEEAGSATEPEVSAGDPATNSAPQSALNQSETQEVRLGELRFEGAAVYLGDTVIESDVISLRDVFGHGVGALQVGTGELVIEGGEVSMALGETVVSGRLGEETIVRLGQSRDGSMRLDTELSNVEVKAGEYRMEAPQLEIEASMLGDTGEVELSVPNDVRLSSTGALAVGDLRLGFRSLRLIREPGQTRVVTDGLSLSLDEDELLALLRPTLPPTFASDEQELDEGVQSTLRGVGVMAARDLSRFRYQVAIAGFSGFRMSFEGGRPRAEGTLDVMLTLLADETEMELTTCHREVVRRVSVPCFEDGSPGFCSREIRGNVPYPCVNESERHAVLFRDAVRIDLDLSGSIESNAPTNLADLSISAGVTRCDRVNVRGVPETLQRAIDLRGTVCEALQEQRQEFALADMMPEVRSSPMLSEVEIDELRLDGNGGRVSIEMGFDATIADATDGPEVQRN